MMTYMHLHFGASNPYSIQLLVAKVIDSATFGPVLNPKVMALGRVMTACPSLWIICHIQHIRWIITDEGRYSLAFLKCTLQTYHCVWYTVTFQPLGCWHEIAMAQHIEACRMLGVSLRFYQAVKHFSNGIGRNYHPSNKRKCK